MCIYVDSLIAHIYIYTHTYIHIYIYIGSKQIKTLYMNIDLIGKLVIQRFPTLLLRQVKKLLDPKRKP